jgi:hypothetical protein
MLADPIVISMGKSGVYKEIAPAIMAPRFIFRKG